MKKGGDLLSTGGLESVGSKRGAPELSELVLTTLALACRVERTAIGRSTRLRDLDVDSLTLVAVLARIEAACGAELAAEDMLTLFEACDVGAFVQGVEALLAGSGLRASDGGDG
jgi:acyl carrier protein